MFAHLRATGSFICESGIDGTWLDANWFDSLCVVRQVLESKHMKREVEAHEAALIVINILMLQALIKEFPLEFCSNAGELLKFINMFRSGLTDNDNASVKKAFEYLNNELNKLDLLSLQQQFDEK